MKNFTSKSFVHPYAQRFFNAVIGLGGTLSNFEKSAVNKLCLDLTTNNLWDNFRALYPFVGGSAISNSVNLIDPNLYRISWNGTVVHNSLGITGNGTNGYGNTNLPLSVLVANSCHIGMYNRTSWNNTNSSSDLGGAKSIFGGLIISLRYNLDSQKTFSYGTGSNQAFGIGRDTSNNELLGLTLGNIFSNSASCYVNGSVFGVSNGSVLPTIFSSEITPYILCTNLGGPIGYSNSNLSLYSLGSGFSNTQIPVLNTIVQNFQSSLNRS